MVVVLDPVVGVGTEGLVDEEGGEEVGDPGSWHFLRRRWVGVIQGEGSELLDVVGVVGVWNRLEMVWIPMNSEVADKVGEGLVTAGVGHRR